MYLTISNENARYEVYWSYPPNYDRPVVLESNRVYTFTVIGEPINDCPSLVVPRVVRVEKDGKMLYDREICDVHHIRMERKEVPILYGLILPGLGEPGGDTAQRLFPHRYETRLGGCCVTPTSPKTDKVYVCSECKKAYANWNANTKPEKPAAASRRSPFR
ncbi:MAG TPA: hypothetical protein VK615_08445 [Candidatus Binatia bacterium]|nr:hypothetical protein [Candidatus Binatia bacterium]